MEAFNSIKQGSKNLVSLRAYKGDAMTFLAFDLDESLKQDFVGFSISYQNSHESKYIYNRMTFSTAFLTNNPQIPPKDKNSTKYSPIQRFSWVHVPAVNDEIDNPFFGEYTYKVTPRYAKNGKLIDLDTSKTVEVKIDVSPFNSNHTKIAFTRGFVSSVAYVSRFGVENNQVRPKLNNDLLFDIYQVSGQAERWNNATHRKEIVDYTFEEQHKWLGWQARLRVLEFLDETIADPNISLKVFAYDLNEPEICKRLLALAAQNRLKIIVDDAGTHKKADSMETDFVNRFKNIATTDPDFVQRGSFKGLAHSKVFIQINNTTTTPTKVLTGSTNFSTNGLYVNSNHILVFDNLQVAQLYSDVFDASFGKPKMDAFKGGSFSKTDFEVDEINLPRMTITFAPHPKLDAERIFERISNRIKKADNTDVLFAIMQDTSKSSILDAVKEQVKNGTVFTYGITDTVSKTDAEYSIFIYKPNSKRAIRVAARGVTNILPPPFNTVPKVDGYAIHHKFVVVNFKGKDPVVYCGSSNLAFGPEQQNGDNLLEIHDRDVVTAFAVEAMRLVDHFHWRNKELKQDKMDLADSTAWYENYYVAKDLRCVQRKLLIQENLV